MQATQPQIIADLSDAEVTELENQGYFNQGIYAEEAVAELERDGYYERFIAPDFIVTTEMSTFAAGAGFQDISTSTQMVSVAEIDGRAIELAVTEMDEFESVENASEMLTGDDRGDAVVVTTAFRDVVQLPEMTAKTLAEKIGITEADLVNAEIDAILDGNASDAPYVGDYLLAVTSDFAAVPASEADSFDPYSEEEILDAMQGDDAIVVMVFEDPEVENFDPYM